MWHYVPELVWKWDKTSFWCFTLPNLFQSLFIYWSRQVSVLLDHWSFTGCTKNFGIHSFPSVGPVFWVPLHYKWTDSSSLAVVLTFQQPILVVDFILRKLAGEEGVGGDFSLWASLQMVLGCNNLGCKLNGWFSWYISQFTKSFDYERHYSRGSERQSGVIWIYR